MNPVRGFLDSFAADRRETFDRLEPVTREFKLHAPPAIRTPIEVDTNAFC